MNNKRQKNIVYGYNGIESLPYTDSNLGKDEIVKNSTNINNAFQQLLDNDLYIENELNKVGNNVVGPKGDDAENTVKSADDGYKYWGGISDGSELSIMHKIESEPQDSVVKVNDVSVKFICGYGNAIFVSSDKLRYTEDGTTFTELGDIVANGYYVDNDNVLFAANDGVYFLTTEIIGFGEQTYALIKVNKNDIGVATTVELDSRNRKIIVGTIEGIYIGDLPTGSQSSKLEENVIFYKKTMSESTRINDIQIVESNGEQIVATDSGMFKSLDGLGFKNINIFHKFDEKTCLCSHEFSGSTYFGMSDGLYKMSNGEPTLVFETGTQVFSFSSNTYELFFNTNNTIYRVDTHDIVTKYVDVGFSVKKVQRIVVGGNRGVILLGTDGSLRFIADDDVSQVVPFSITDRSITDIIVKLGSMNILFAQTQTGLVTVDIGKIYSYASDAPSVANEFRDNLYIDSNLPDGSLSNSFMNLVEADDKLFVVTSKYVVDINDSELRYEVPSGVGEIRTFQNIKDGNLMKYLLVCEKFAAVLNSSFQQTWSSSAANGESFIGGHCCSDLMVLFIHGSDGNNRVVSYSFPLKIDQVGSISIPTGSRVKDVVENGSTIFFTVDTKLYYTTKKNAFNLVKQDNTIDSFDIVNVTSPVQSDPYSAILKHYGSNVCVEIMENVSVETDEDGDATYYPQSTTLSIGNGGNTVNGVYYNNNTVYSLTNKGVIETPLIYFDEKITADTQTTHLSSKDIRGATVTENAKLFVDSSNNVYGIYDEPASLSLLSTKNTVYSFLSGDNEGTAISAYADSTTVYIQNGTRSHKDTLSCVTKMIATNGGIVVQNESGISVISENTNKKIDTTHFTALNGFGVGMIDVSQDEETDDIIAASKTQLKRYTYENKTATIKLLHNFEDDGLTIASISKVSDNTFVVNHGSSYSTCVLDSSGTLTCTRQSYPNGIKNVAFFCHHNDYLVAQKRSDGNYTLSSYSNQNGSDIKNLSVIQSYADGDESFVYSTSSQIVDESGTVLYSGSGVQKVFSLDSNDSSRVVFQNANGLHITTTQTVTKQIDGVSASNIWSNGGFLFFLKGQDLYCGKISTIADTFKGATAILNSTTGIRDVTFVESEYGQRIYVLATYSLYMWDYNPEDGVDGIKEKTNYKRIDLTGIPQTIKSFVDGKVVVTKDGASIDITSGIFNTTESDDTFVNHGIFLSRHDVVDEDGFYQMTDGVELGEIYSTTYESVTRLMDLNGDVIFGSSQSGKGGIYSIDVENGSYTSNYYDFGNGVTYKNQVNTLFVANNIPYVKNTNSWKMLQNGSFVIVDVFNQFGTINGIAVNGGKTYFITNSNIYTLSYGTLYGITLGTAETHTFDGKGIDRIVDDKGLIRVLVMDKNLLTEYKTEIGINGYQFKETGSPDSKVVVYVNNTTQSGEKFTLDDDGYHIVRNDTVVTECPKFEIEDVNVLVKVDGIYVVGTSSKEMYSFEGIVDDVSYDKISNTESIRFHKIVPISDTQYLTNSTKGIYSYYAQSGILIKNSIKETNDVPALETYRFSEYESKGYIYGTNDGSVFTSTNYKNWELFVTIPDVKITDVFVRNSKEYYIGTDKGLYKTSYKYTVVNDIPKYTIENASELYNSMFDQLSAMVHAAIQEHIEQNHGISSFIGYVNDEILSTNFDPIVNFYSESKLCLGNELSTIQATNDLVAEMYTSDEADGDIMLSVTNFLSSYQVEDFSYTMKRYTSGVTELFIYVPTTNTYYLPHVDGASYCVVDKDIEIKRKNLGSFDIDKQSVKSTTNGNYTDIVMSITSSLYHIDNILDIEINGNSLPLKIYKDSEYEATDGDAVYMFHSKIYPSVVRKYDISKTDDEGYYNFKFSCFGSDAQAIRICFYDSQNHKSDDTYKVHFNLNGGVGTFSDQRFNVGQSKSLKRAEGRITNGTKIFQGWSLRQNPADNSSPDYVDSDNFPGTKDIKPYMRDKVVNLYAIWLDYKFGDDDTVLVLDTNGEEFYINSGDVLHDSKLGNKVVIRYED